MGAMRQAYRYLSGTFCFASPSAIATATSLAEAHEHRGEWKTPVAPMALLSPQVLTITPPSSSSSSYSAAAFFPARPPRLPARSFSSPRRSDGLLSLTVPGEKAAPSPVLVRATPSSSGSTSPAGPGAEILGDVAVYSALTGEPVLFRDLWDQNEGMAVVALLRHFGCFCCWELASVLRDAKSRFDSAGAKLIAVGVGTPDKARILAERLPFPLDCLYADPDRKAYDALGLYYGLGRTFFNPASAKVFSRLESVQMATKNYTIAATPDDKSSVLQQGGMFIFKGKQLLYARKDEGTGDHAPLEDVLNVCFRAPVA